MLLACALVRALGLLPAGISFSAPRLTLATLLGLAAYPAGFLSVFLQVWTLFALFKNDQSGAGRELLDLVIAYALLAAMLFVGGAVTLLILSFAFALAVRFWPPRALRKTAAVIGVTILASPVASFLHFMLYLHRAPDRIALLHFLREPLLVLFSFAWGMPLAVVIAAPIFAALVGHWLHLAAEAWSADSA